MSSKRARGLDDDSESDGYNDDENTHPQSPDPTQPVKRGRGRPISTARLARNETLREGRSSRSDRNGNQNAEASGNSTSAVADADTATLSLKDDEYVLEEDPAGEKKIKKNGELLGNRDYRVRTFTLGARGDRLYMLSTEPARCMGFRDSYLLFQKHRSLCKVVISDEEKFELIERGIIPHSYKGRVIGVVTARSIFREFGSRIIIGGHRVVDDYYEARAVALGHSASELADPDDRLPPPGEPYSKNQYVAWFGASSVYHQPQTQPAPASTSSSTAPVSVTAASSALQGGSLRGPTEPANIHWLSEAAHAVVKLNRQFLRQRAPLRNPAGLIEPHTGAALIAKATQPEHAKITHIPNSRSNRITVSYMLELGSHKDLAPPAVRE